jgi:hypothetical protein
VTQVTDAPDPSEQPLPEPPHTVVAHVSAPQPMVPVQASAGTSGLFLAALLSGAVVAALIAAAVNTALARRKSLEEERSRVRTVFAEAFEAVSAYKEFPYAIRRRRADVPAEERVRLSEELRKVQTRLTYYLAWTGAESQEVGDAYKALVAQLRRLAGSACRDAWLADPITEDSQMNIGPDLVDLSALADLETAYTRAAQTYLDDYLRLGRVWRRTG